ncbi:hypothetical protein MLD38_008549 [Melastoma candidum]|uniref:Uncharacterized protein n=1 Tax=Melastoma candidum TaxID=119954 RepID=A0ACB9RTT8_9MYRT|nr:hypothetical protein MLD38_008549 [Melastoma candidum]
MFSGCRHSIASTKLYTRGDGFVGFLEEHVQEVLLGEGGGGSYGEGVEEVIVGCFAQFEDEHPRIEVQGRRRALFGWPLDLVRALLAVTDRVLRYIILSYSNCLMPVALITA